MVPTSKRVINAGDVLEHIITWILAVSFLIAGTAHWGNPYFFLGSVYAYELTDSGMGQVVAMSLPLIQLGLAACLLLRLFVDAAHLGTLFLLLTFATAQTIAFCRGLDISCGCFGAGNDKPIGWLSLSIVYGLLLMSLIRNGFQILQRPSTLKDPNK
ncbi:MAG: MauE/DoxX family redox-associated membrane protein [Planctomycetia bacterium]|nr:MauE/DoxX family redox-associated membrane protein [Planctomycetia bacterium]